MISSVDLAHYAVSCAKDWVSVDYGTSNRYLVFYIKAYVVGVGGFLVCSVGVLVLVRVMCCL